ncbi:TetR family transcriptional regulator [Micromonospora sp. DR5-3]|uniref:TetR/AcrR family transcriptional regulator n=1 Tax=unclassified Micromonospora TaxID=2617518 RepID=UPI0011DAAD1D|nr:MULTISPECIES: TetR family transcriptional regulator [unclassified Micromonospora]MCW3817307.1 TetR family transcriptional regulator [Micromonospora sp. DR5-3]TYC24060.1 TetR/AcrR family transcriptional regulator [Micromonospora sp. MP36]
MRARRTGRRPGNPDTREAILAAARTAFAERGFDAASIRAIATAAGVDPALVHHYFGTKEELFRATVAIPIDPAELLPAVLAAGPDRAGERLIRTFLSVWDSPVGGAAVALLRSAVSNEWTARLLREFLVTQVLRRVLDQLDVDPAELPLRGALVGSQLAGLAMMRYVIRLEPVASAAPETLVTAIAPTVQRYLTGDLSTPPPAG